MSQHNRHWIWCMISKLLEHSGYPFTWLIMQIRFVLFLHYHTFSKQGPVVWVSHVSTSSLLCVAAVLRTRVKSRVLSKRPPKSEWNANISTSLCIMLHTVCSSFNKSQLAWGLTSHPWNPSSFGATLTSTSGFLLIVSVFLASVSRCAASGSGRDGNSFTVSANPFDSIKWHTKYQQCHKRTCGCGFFLQWDGH